MSISRLYIYFIPTLAMHKLYLLRSTGDSAQVLLVAQTIDGAVYE